MPFTTLVGSVIAVDVETGVLTVKAPDFVVVVTVAVREALLCSVEFQC